MKNLFSREIGYLLLHRLFYGLLLLQAAIALFGLLYIPSDLEKGIIWGLSWARLFLLSFPLATVIAGGYLFTKALRDRTWLQKSDQRLHAWFSSNARWKKLTLLSVLIIIGSLYVLSINRGVFTIYSSPEDAEPSFNVYAENQIYGRLMPYLVRIQPLVILLLGVCVQIAILLPIYQLGVKEWSDQLKKNNIYLIASLYAALLILWRGISWTRLKLFPDYAYSSWAQLGTPLLDIQVWLAFAIGLGLAGIAIRVAAIRKSDQASRTDILSKLDLVIAVLVWVVATFHWLSTPMQANWFVAAPRYPNFESYPNSDAYLYDTTAHGLMVGEGLKTGVYTFAIRPMHAFYLAGLYGLVGVDYEKAIAVQCAILAIFPALVYLLTQGLHNRLSGLIAAILIILREGNAIALIDRIRGTNSRTLMAEMPTVVGVALILLAVFVWLRLPQRRLLIALISGCILAVFILIRPEIGFFLIPPWVLLAGIIYLRTPGQWFKNVLMLFLGLFFFLTPWLWRNWRKTGLLYLERPYSKLDVLSARSGFEINLGPPDESTVSAAPDVRSEVRQTYLVGVQSSYANNQIQALLIFPDAFHFVDNFIGTLNDGNISDFWKTCCTRDGYIDRFRFWRTGKWVGAVPLPSQSVIPILLNLFLIVTGLIKVSGRKKMGGFYLLMVVSGYYLISSSLRVSGGRHVQIVDWIWIIFYGAGLGTVIEWVVSSLQSGNLPGWLFAGAPQSLIPTLAHQTSSSSPSRTYTAICIAIFFFGASLPLYESSIQPRYTEQTKQAWFEELRQSEKLLKDHPDIWNALQNSQQNRLLILQGRALYPRFYLQKEGELGVNVTPFTRRGYNRLNFYIVGPENAGVQLPLLERPNITFPHAEDVLVIGCKENNDLVAFLVYYKSPETILVSDPLPHPLTCKPPIRPRD